MIKSKVMGEQNSHIKLYTKIVLEKSSKTSTTKKLIFTDNSIEKYLADFIGPKGTRYRRYKTFYGKAPKGLSICQYEKSQNFI